MCGEKTKGRKRGGQKECNGRLNEMRQGKTKTEERKEAKEKRRI